MQCTLKIISGPDASQEFACSGETCIGRSQRCQVRLTSTAVSFEHAMLTRSGDEFFLENLSANGTLLNGQRLLAKTRLRAKDQIQLGDTVLRVERLPDAAGASSSRRMLLMGAVAVALVVMIVVIMDPFSKTQTTDNLNVYHIFQQYVQFKAARGEIPPDVPAMLTQAWRLRIAGNRDDAVRQWAKLYVVLDTWDRDQGRDVTNDSPAGLSELESGAKTSLPDMDMRIAFKQWVIQMERGQ